MDRSEIRTGGVTEPSDAAYKALIGFATSDLRGGVVGGVR